MRGTGGFGRVLRITLVAALLAPRSVVPATITVQGGCTLVNAIIAANEDVRSGGCSAGSGADTLRLTADVVLTAPHDDDNGLPQVTSEIRLRGFGYSIERAPGAPKFRILDVRRLGDLTLEEVTIANGDSNANGGGIRTRGAVTLRGSTLSNNNSKELGGGIYGKRSTIVLESSTVSGNTARRGAGITGYEYTAVTISDSEIIGNVASSRGGGLLLNFSDPSTLSNSTLSGNSAASGGGARLSFYAALEVVDSTITRNTADFEGGGIMNHYSALELTRSRVMENSARDGGGIWAGIGYFSTNLRYSSIYDNTASEKGGGVAFVAYGGDLSFGIQNTTISGNTAETGGGLYQRTTYYRHDSRVFNSTIVDNTASSGAGIYFNNNAAYKHLIRDSIIAGNNGANCAGPEIEPMTRTLDSDGSCPGASSATPDSDFDARLRDNGGRTPTHALLEGSVAIDVLSDCFIETDQRGFRRDANCDAGAFEFGAEGLGASVTGLELSEVSCRNRSTRQRGEFQTSGNSWLCGDLGVSARPGDRIRMGSLATVTGEGAVGGSVTGLVAAPPPRVICRNVTTGTKVSVLVPSFSWDCEAAGLEVSPGDQVRFKIKGRS